MNEKDHRDNAESRCISHVGPLRVTEEEVVAITLPGSIETGLKCLNQYQIPYLLHLTRHRIHSHIHVVVSCLIVSNVPISFRLLQWKS